MPLRVMVVDHDAATLDLMQEVFSAHDVQLCTDGVQAVAPIVEQKFDGFVLEMDMPSVDGCRLARWIRQSPRNARAPIIHMSAQPNQRSMQRAFEAGGTFFLMKPLDRGRLARLFRSIRGVMLQERRRYWRIPLAVPSYCAVGARRVPRCSIRNLSATGTLLRGDGSLDPGATVYLAFALSEADRSMVSAWGTVVRVDDHGHAGVRFTRLSRTDHRKILERIAAESDAA